MTSSIRRHLMLVEMFRLNTVLLEARIDFVTKKYLPLLTTALQSGSLTIPPSILAHLPPPPPKGKVTPEVAVMQQADALLQYIVSVDPDPVKKNVQWLLTLILRKKQPMPLEDVEYAGETLAKFAEMKQARLIPADRADINRYRSLSDLNAAMRGEQQQQVAAGNAEEQAMLKQCDVLYDGPDYRVLSFLTEGAARYFSRGAAWCTAWGDPNGQYPTRTSQFRTYINAGPLYFVKDKSTGDVWQFSFEKAHYCDANDKMINLGQFLATHPKINAIFEKLDGEPIAVVAGHPVFRHKRGIAVKTAAGPQATILLSVTVGEGRDEGSFAGEWMSAWRRALTSGHDDRLAGHRGGAARVRYPDTAPAEVAQLLNRLGIVGDPLGAVEFDLYFRNNTWGAFSELADVVLRDGLLVWRGIATRHDQVLDLSNADGEWVMDGLLDTDGAFAITDVADSAATKDELLPAASHAVTELLLVADVKRWLHTSKLKAPALTVDDATRLVATKPFMGDLVTVFKIEGPTDVVKSMVVNWCKDSDVTTMGEWTGNDMVIEKFADIDSLVEKLGDDEAKQAIAYLSGDEHYEVDATAERSDVRTLIDGLPPKLLTALGHYLAETYAEVVEDEFDGFDPSSADDVYELFTSTDDDDVQRAADRAVSTGQRYGAESDMSRLLLQSIKQSSYVAFTPRSDMPKEPQWDGECQFVVPMKSIIDFVQEHGEDEAAESLRYSDWEGCFDVKIEGDRPYYGYEGCDEDAAQEDFAEGIHKFLPADTSRSSHAAGEPSPADAGD